METYGSYNIRVVLFAACGPLFAGYALAVIVATLGQPTFYSSLNLVADPTAPGYSHTSVFIGAATGVNYGAGVIGCLISGWLSEKIGRVNGFRVYGLIGLIGGILQTAAVNQGMYLVARVVTGLAAGQLMTAMPPYFAEVATPHSRGLMAGAQGSFANLGFALAAWIGYACYHASGTSFGWRFPNAVLILLALSLLGGAFYIPESPRWLVGRNMDDKALAILCRLHHDANDAEDRFAHSELALIKAQLDVDRAAIETHGRWQLFTESTYRRRVILAVMVIAGGQNVGILVINTYNTLLYKSLGLTTSEALVVGAAYNTWATIANMIGAQVSDRLGRRRLMVIGFFANVGMFAIATALIAEYSVTLKKAYAASSVVFLFLYVGTYGGLIDVHQWTVATEVFPSHLRSQGTAIAISTLFLLDTLWLSLAPTASRTIGWKYYLVFVCLGLVHSIYLYFKLPETAGLALEEIDRLFGKEVTALDNLDSADAIAVSQETKT